MRLTTFIRLWQLAAVLVLAISTTPSSAQSALGIYRELFTGFDRANNDLSQLTNSPAFLNNLANSTNIITTSLQTPSLGIHDYGQRLRAFITAPTTGNYTFWIASDEVSNLLLSTNENPANKQLIAYVDPRSQPANYTTHAGQQSTNITLQAGQRYYLEVLHKEANLIDHLSVQWRLPNNVVETPIPASRFVYEIPPLLIQQPADLNVEEGRPALFQPAVANFLPQSYRWERDGANLSGATNQALLIEAAALADDGVSFRAFITNRFGATNTIAARLTVRRDTNAPLLLSVFSVSRTNLFVIFSEAVDPASALNAQNYHLTDATVSAAAFAADAQTVLLTTTPFLFPSPHTLSVSNILDRASIPNQLAVTQIVFTAQSFNPQIVGNSPAGSVTASGSGADVSGSGRDIGGTTDQFQFGWQSVVGDFDFQVRVQSLDFTDIWAKAGLMARESLAADSRFAAVFATPSLAGSFFEQRTNRGGFTSTSGAGPATFPNSWLRLRRSGDQFTGYAGSDGENWTPLGTVMLSISNRLHLGFAVTSHDSNLPAAAQFRDFGVANGSMTGAIVPVTEPLGPSSRRTGLVISEMMYHPRDLWLGGRLAELEFVELFNSNPWPEDLAGFQLSGDIDFTFPPDTILGGGRFLVVAKSPADVQSVYGITGVLGPFTNNLPNDTGRVRLRNNSGHVFLEVNYSSRFPWPVAADGAGHSLVLARPSFGEGQREAWSASDAVGGSPGRAEPLGTEPLRPVVINEFLAHSDAPFLDFVELYNHSNRAIDLGGAWLSDNPATNKFRIPSPTMLPPRGFVAFDQTQLGFSFKSGGDRIFLVNSNQTRVLDAVGFDGQASGVSSGRYPDGAPGFSALSARTPADVNAPPLSRDIVINEIMYHPISGNLDDEFVELFNRGIAAVDLGGWKFVDGISFTFPVNTILPAAGYLVIAKNKTNLLAHYANLNMTNTVGDFSGTLSHAGERLALAMPVPAINADNPANITTNIIFVVVNEVAYRTGGRWGQWSDGGGSSLELIDPHSDNRLAPNWADSDETAKAPWTIIETTGLLDNGGDTADSLHIILLEAGECLLDDVEVVMGAGANLITNPGFESGLTGWTARGNHERSSIENTGFTGARSLHVRASSRGDIGANKIRAPLTSALSAGQTATIRAKVKWLRGWPEILLRLRGSYLEATDRMIVPPNPGTPGAPNSRLVANAGPAITDVTHTPAVPAANQPVVVTAHVADPDGLASFVVKYRIDPAANFAEVTLNDDGLAGDAVAGDGLWSATIPGQPADTLVAFVLEATDAAVTPASSRFPAMLADNGPTRECLVHFGSPVPATSFGTYRFWITQNAVTNWATRDVLSNERVNGTFVYGNQRVIYNAGARYSGSPAHQDQAAPDYSPVGTPNHYAFDVPADDLLLGTDNFNKVHGPGNNHHDDASLLREVTAYWMARQAGLPANYKRDVVMFINGARRGSLMEDTQVPGSEVVNEVFPDDPDGDLFKLAVWYEFGLTGPALSFSSVSGANLNNYTTTGGAKKRARYRWNWEPRALNGTANNFTNLYALIDAANSLTNQANTSLLESVADLDQWMRTFALEHAVGNWDSFGFRNAQNMFAYKPTQGRWSLLIWDINIVFGGGTRGTPVGPVGDNLLEFPTGDTPMSLIYARPVFLRAYWRALKEIVNGPMLNANADPFMDARHVAYSASGVNVTPPDAIKVWISLRHAYLAGAVAAVDNAPFSITSPSSFSSASNYVSLTGLAPLDVRVFEVNGVVWSPTWTSVSNWTLRLPLSEATNQLTIIGHDENGNFVPGASNQIAVIYTGPIPSPASYLVINEIMYHPLVPDAEFIELFNTSSNFTFDLSGWRLDGLGYEFPAGTVITNRQFLVIAKNRAVFLAAYPGAPFPFGEFPGQLDHGGETLKLIQPGSAPALDLVVDKVKYDDAPPWPTAADGGGLSLQLIDAEQDNARVANWKGEPGWAFVSKTGNILNGTNLLLWLSAPGNLFIDDVILVGLGGTNILINGGFESDLSPAWMVPNFYAGSTITSDVSHSGQRSLFLVGTNAGGAVATSVVQNFGATVSSNTVYTLSFWVLANTNSVTVNARTFLGNNLTVAAAAQRILATPGAPNSSAGVLPPFPLVWLNEVLPRNVTSRTDHLGQHLPWLELFNSDAVPLSLDDFFLADNFSNLTQWPFPPDAVLAPGEFKILFLDGQPGQSTATEWHTSFALHPDGGDLALARLVAGAPQIVDYLHYPALGPDRSFGSFPDGQLFDRQEFFYVTPGASNNAHAAPLIVFINEWMAANTTTLADPADGKFDDWFELYNPGDTTMDLAGHFLTDNLSNPFQFAIPAGYTIAPHGHLLVWADNDPGQNATNRADLHVNFQLAKGGEAIGLYAADGTAIDTVIFGAQTNDVSQGRCPDGGATIVFQTTPTPRTVNMCPAPPPSLRLTGVMVLGNGDLSLGFDTVNGHHYRVEFKNNLNDPDWSPLGTDRLATTDNLAVTVPLSESPQRFFRVLQTD